MRLLLALLVWTMVLSPAAAANKNPISEAEPIEESDYQYIDKAEAAYIIALRCHALYYSLELAAAATADFNEDSVRYRDYANRIGDAAAALGRQAGYSIEEMRNLRFRWMMTYAEDLAQNGDLSKADIAPCTKILKEG